MVTLWPEGVVVEGVLVGVVVIVDVLVEVVGMGVLVEVVGIGVLVEVIVGMGVDEGVDVDDIVGVVVVGVEEDVVVDDDDEQAPSPRAKKINAMTVINPILVT
jgi:hypothetical protein